MRRILVTGGAGFIGSNFIHYWLRQHPEDQITNLDKLSYAGYIDNLKDIQSHPGYDFVRGDICDAELIRQLFKAKEFTTVVHFAAESHVDRSILGPDDFIQTNIQGTFTLLQAARAHWLGAGCSGEAFRFLHISTDEVFGSLGPEDPPCNETTRYSPNSPYSASKAASDHLARAYFHTYGLPILISNASNNYGPFQFPEKLIPLVIDRAIGQEFIPVYGDGQNVRDWLYVEDHCRALEAVLERGRVGESYNIGGGNQWKNIELVNLICELLEQRLNRHVGSCRSLVRFVEDRPGHDRRYALDSSKITHELGWAPIESLRSGIAKTIDWYLGHRDWVQGLKTTEYEKYFAAQYGERLSSKT